MPALKNNRPLFQPLESRTLQAADLAIIAMQVEEQMLDVRKPTHAVITVKNVGKSASSAGLSTRFVLSRDATIGNADDINLGVLKIDKSLAAGASVDLTLNSIPSVGHSGVFRLGGIADVYHFENESKENNNARISEPLVTYYQDYDHDTLLGDAKGTAKNDVVQLYVKQNKAIIQVNTKVWAAPLTESVITFDAGDGNDKVIADAQFPVKLDISGGTGHDTLKGGAADDKLSGGIGKDRIWGNGGNDYLVGGAHDDRLYAGPGNDQLTGGAGNDFLYAGPGAGTLLGGGGKDRFFTKGNGYVDEILGGAGKDQADADANDNVSSV